MHRNGTEAMRYRSYFVERTSVLELNVSKVKKKNERMLDFFSVSSLSPKPQQTHWNGDLLGILKT